MCPVQYDFRPPIVLINVMTQTNLWRDNKFPSSASVSVSLTPVLHITSSSAAEVAQADARERLRNSFYPEHTHRVLCDGVPVGFYTFRSVPEGLRLEHLYIHPDFQSRGIGGRVLTELLAVADEKKLPVFVGALRDSASNRFYLRHGFEKVTESEWDIAYRRASAFSRAPSLKPA